jgi:phospholipid-binding lipoprotein MlaA
MIKSFASRAAFVPTAATVVATLLLAGCATPPADGDAEARADWEQVNDPLEPANRAVFEFNQAIDRALFKPAAKGYRAAVPQFGRDRIHDFLANLRSPVIFVNDLLQGQPDRAAQTFFRAAMNTGIGLLGLLDVATEAGIPYHDEDFGQTFAVWGVGEGPYLMLPVLGPSNPRDLTGYVAEWVADPVNYRLDAVGYAWGSYARAGTSGLDKRERLLDPLDEVERSSLDYYASIRALYRQRRNAEIKNGQGSEKLPAPGVSWSGGARGEDHSPKAQ